ncbi:MAG: sulfurtransferase TusA family protein [Chloroflexi bacterium]|nr:sulfurtransferase TusA family protein [Chloroflexota bacterium]
MSERAASVSELESHTSLNPTSRICPLNFVKTKLTLEEMEDGQILEVVLDDGEPMRNVPRSLKEEGHRILKVQRLEDDSYRLWVRKAG